MWRLTFMRGSSPRGYTNCMLKDLRPLAKYDVTWWGHFCPASGLVFIAGLAIGLSPLHASADTPSVERVKQGLAQFKADKARACTDLELFEIARDGMFSREDIRAIWETFKRSQHPRISASDLSLLVSSKRDLVFSNVSIACSIERTVYETIGGTTKSFENYELLSVGSKLKTTRSVPDGSHDAKLARSSTSAYDGEVVRVVQQAGKGQVAASINQFGSRSPFFSLDSTLAVSMLVNSEYDLDMLWLVYDLVAMLNEPMVVVLEHQEPLEGRSCTVVTNELFRAFLDPKLNYAVVRFEQYTSGYDAVAMKLAPREISCLRECSDFHDYGNGVWLPRSVRQTWSAGSTCQREANTTLLSVKLGTDAKDEDFRSVIPTGAMVSDNIKGLVYVTGRNASIAQILSGEVRPARRSNLWAIFYVNLILLVVFIGILVVRVARKRGVQ
jgi:hypothetical protein